jgi:hypothetical protein
VMLPATGAISPILLRTNLMKRSLKRPSFSIENRSSVCCFLYREHDGKLPRERARDCAGRLKRQHVPGKNHSPESAVF